MDVLNKGINTTNGNIFIMGERTLERLEIQFIPQQLELDRKANITEIGIVGRNTPQYQYLNGSTELAVEFDFHTDERTGMSVVNKVRWLESLLASERYVEPPERVKLIWGKLFRYEMWILKSMKATYKEFDKTKDGLPRQGYAACVFALDPKNNLVSSDLRTYKGY